MARGLVRGLVAGFIEPWEAHIGAILLVPLILWLIFNGTFRGARGATLMDIGVTLAGGCFTPAINSSPDGWMMGIGLMAGPVIGLTVAQDYGPLS
ncbi:MAG: hypothetical protein JJD98_15675 [Polaromonas sp.]|nr:hypothetical protein [Polaromonas sp.]